MSGDLPDLNQQDVLDHLVLTAYIAELAEWDNHAHLERVRRYTHVLATGAGLRRNVATLISISSILHDVGKIALPESILKKTGHFERAEYKIAEQHTVEGARLLSGSGSAILQTGEIIARTHHERWDGSGYPQGLAGEAIPISGRVVALVDVFDALMTERPYKTHMPPEAASELIKGSAGSLFDPKLVAIFVDRIQDFKLISQMQMPASRHER
jgi:putative two-component system response regulator